MVAEMSVTRDEDGSGSDKPAPVGNVEVGAESVCCARVSDVVVVDEVDESEVEEEEEEEGVL